MRDERVVRIFAHRQNIKRYKALMETPLTTLERDFIDRRIIEEETEVRRLCAERARFRNSAVVLARMGRTVDPLRAATA